MTTETIDRAEVFSRPAARFDADGNIEVRASSALGCRRALWYAATNYEPTNPPSEESLTAMEAGNALEPVVVQGDGAGGLEGGRPRPPGPEAGGGQGRPEHDCDRTPRRHGADAGGAGRSGCPQLFLFEGETQGPAYGDPMVVEIKTRGPEAFKRWQTLGAERSHPASVAQAAFYSLGEFGDLRDAVIATMDTGARTWDWERIPAKRLERALQDACAVARRGWPPTTSKAGRTPTRCRSGTSPLLAGSAEAAPSWRSACRVRLRSSEDDETETEEVTDEEARDAVAAYSKAQESIKEPEKAKRGALDTLKAWMRRQGDSKAMVGGRTVTLVSSTRYSVNHRRLNEALDPEVRAEIVTESESEYVRVS